MTNDSRPVNGKMKKRLPKRKICHTVSDMNAENSENTQKSKDPHRASMRFKKLETKTAYEDLAERSGGKFSFNSLAEMAMELAYDEVNRRVDAFKRGFTLGRSV